MSVFARLGLETVINASGKMTALGASAVSPEVADVLAKAAGDYVDIERLLIRAGEHIAQLIGAEAACPTTGAAAGIAISVAACITKGKPHLVELMPDSENLPNEVIIAKGHSVNFGGSVSQMVRIGGGRLIEVGHANSVQPWHVRGAINPKTCALLYVKSHHTVQKGMVSLADMIAISKETGIPLIIDAAAEEDLSKYHRMGADLVVYSGGKAIEGPTSGFVCGRKELILAVHAQYKGIARPMKIGKEGIMGLVAAVERYLSLPHQKLAAENRAKMEWLCDALSGIPHIVARIAQDEAGREIYRCQVSLDEQALGMTAAQVIHQLETGRPAIYTRNHQSNLGIIAVDPRPLLPGQEQIVAQRLVEILSKREVSCNG